jgi:hypothetical protein
MISDEERVLKFAVKFDAETAVGQTNQMLIMALIITLISNFRKALLRARASRAENQILTFRNSEGPAGTDMRYSSSLTIVLGSSLV